MANRGIQVFGYDKMKQLVWFWQGLCSDNNKLADEVEKLREQYLIRNGDTVTGCSKEAFHQYREDLKIETFMFSYERAAKYYIINRSGFSGATFSGGWSERASYARFTESSVQRLRDFNAQKFRVDYADFEDAIFYHPKAFLYLDPPYMLKGSQNSLYGVDGNLHDSFDHERLHGILTNRAGWLMSYNDCPEIRDMYKDYEIVEAEWSYGMTNVYSKEEKKKKAEEGYVKKQKQSSEILIKG